jgi:hypothetical protein
MFIDRDVRAHPSLNDPDLTRMAAQVIGNYLSRRCYL